MYLIKQKKKISESILDCAHFQMLLPESDVPRGKMGMQSRQIYMAKFQSPLKWFELTDLKGNNSQSVPM